MRDQVHALSVIITLTLVPGIVAVGNHQPIITEESDIKPSLFDDIELADFDGIRFDYNIEDKMKPINPDVQDYFHFMDEEKEDLFNIENKSVTSDRRRLSATSALFGEFSPLTCNPVSWSSCTSKVSDNLPSKSSPLVIPCGQCYTFDMEGNVTFAEGINIIGKLQFPLNHKATISTPFVIVQGELEIVVDTPQVSPENKATTFILTGTNDVIFNPTDSPNQKACASLPNGQCNIGKKPFLIAGGKVNIMAISDSCITHTPIQRKIAKDPSYDPEDFPKFVELPMSCPKSGIKYISYDFNEGFGNWTGKEGTFLVSADGTSLTVTNRKLHWQGPYLDLTPIRPELCFIPGQVYLFVAR